MPVRRPVSDDGPQVQRRTRAVNLYDMYIANGMNVGFWVKRRTWGDLCARVTQVGELDRKAHCHGHPAVRADLFHFSSGELKQADAELLDAASPKTWRQIPPPTMHVWGHSKKRAATCASG